jgi:hypothetical protein
MRRILLVALLVVMAAAVSTSVAAAKRHKPATYKTGTYKAVLSPELTKFSITLKRASCPSAPGQGKSSLHLCVGLSIPPIASCHTPVQIEVPLSGFAPPLQLPSSGKLTQQGPVNIGPELPGAPPTTGQSAYSVTFTKKGTATGYVEINMMIAVTPTQPLLPCSSGKLPFTAKLG